MDLKYVNPFVSSAVSVIKEVVGVTAIKKQIYVAKGKESLGGVSIFFNIIGDAEGQIIFDLPPGISTAIAQEMIGLNLKEIIKDMEQKELFKSAIAELGNMISGTAITKLEEYNYDCDIKSPQVYVGPTTLLTHPSIATIVIEMNTDIGDFSINLVNKKQRYLENIEIVMVKTNNDINEAIATKLLPKGFYLYSTNEMEQVKYYLRNKKVDFILIDVDHIINELDSTINSFRELSGNTKFKIIVFSDKKDRNFLLRIQKLGAAGLLLKSTNTEQVLIKLQGILARLGVKLNEKRKQISIKIDASNMFKVNIKLSEKLNISGMITELSMNGLTFIPENKEIVKSLDLPYKSSDIQINLKGKYILTDGAIEIDDNDNTIIKFISLKEKFSKILALAVFDKMSSFNP